MEAQITYGTTIHHDGTIAKFEGWTFETEEEFWKQYDLMSADGVVGDLGDLTLQVREWISIETYRKEVKING